MTHGDDTANDVIPGDPTDRPAGTAPSVPSLPDIPTGDGETPHVGPDLPSGGRGLLAGAGAGLLALVVGAIALLAGVGGE